MKILKKFLLFTITLSIIILIPINSFSDDNVTIFLEKGATTPWPGYLIEQKKMEYTIKALYELEYIKKLSEIENKYYEEKINSIKLEKELELTKTQKQHEAVENELARKLADKSVWYKSPSVVALSTAFVILIALLL